MDTETANNEEDKFQDLISGAVEGDPDLPDEVIQAKVREEVEKT